VLKLMSYVPYILMIFLFALHPVWGDSDVERCEGPDCTPAIPGLRTERPETPVEGDGAVVTGRRGTEITEAERRRLDAQREIEAARRAALETAQPDTTAGAKSLTECEKITDKAEKCSCVADMAKEFQKKSLAFKSEAEGSQSLMELMKKRDDLAARMAVVKTLLDVWDDYHKYLEESPDLNGTADNPGGSPMKAINDLKKLRDFIGSHSKSIQRYHLTSEVLMAVFQDPNNPDVKNREILQGLETPEAKLDFIKAKIQAKCDGASSNLYMCKNRAWEQITPRTDWDTPTNGEGDNLNRLANAIVAVDGLEIFDFRNTMNLSKLFVDRENINITGMSDVSEGLTGLIDASIASCQQEVLNRTSGETECFSRSLESITENNPSLRRQYETLKANFSSTLGRNYNMDNIGGLVNTYVHITKKTKVLHDEANSGTFKDLYNLTETLGNPSEELIKASATLNDPATRSKIQNQFKNITKANMAKLGRTLAGMNLKESEEVYRKLGGTSSSTLFRNGAFEFKDKSDAQNANNILNAILCREGSAAECSGSPINLFKEVDGKAAVDESQLESAFSKLVATVKDRGELSELLLPDREGSLANQIKKIDEQIEALNNDNKYKHMAAFKNYLYDRARTFCVNDSTPGNIEIKGTRCTLTPGVDVGLNNFLKVGGELIGIQNAVDYKMSVDGLASLCQEIRANDYDTYRDHYLNSGICPSVQNYKLTLERTATRAATEAYNREYKGIGDPNTIVDWEPDGKGGYKVASVYRVPNAWDISQYAVPAAQVGVTLFQPLMTHNLFGFQVDNMRRAGINQEYNIAFQNHVNEQYAQCDPSGTGANFFAYNNCITSVNAFMYNGVPMGTNQNFSGGFSFGGTAPISL
jgi:hypothetical protein